MDRFLDYVSESGLDLYPHQEEALLEIFSGYNVILSTPTGSGKSLVALGLHFKSFSEGRRSIYTCPIKALVNEKFLHLCSLFGPEQVGMMTGDGSVNRDAPILCCTAEILANMALRQGADTPYDQIIMDEFHYYSDRERGVAWQIPLLTLPKAQFLLMSATLGDTQFFVDCLTQLTKKKTVTINSDQRPVPLTFNYSEYPLEITLADLITARKFPVYIVHFTQLDCAETAQALMSTNFCTSEEKKLIAQELIAIDFSSPYGKEVNRFLRHGIGIHHGGLLPRYRSLVERLSQKGLLKLICGTDTLGVGVNVPIRTVLFTKLCKYDGASTAILRARDFHQISGRAGRRGFDNAGDVVALAPEHVIENLKMEAKIAKDPSKAKKFVRKKPPEHGYVPWTEQTFKDLITKKAEKLESQFRVNHGMLLNVLSRKGDGCRAMQLLIRQSHNDDKSKRQQFHLGFKLFRTLLDRKIIEFVDPSQNEGQKLRVNVVLQDDFSLDHELSLYLVDSLKLLDPTKPDYYLDIVSQVEAILENPDIILRRQLDKLKTQKMAEMKAEGLEYEERLAELEKLEHPKPNRDFIYNTFNDFVSLHPWLTLSNIKPKSIAREMFEEFFTFGEYVNAYGIQRSEGILLRYLSQFYKVLVQNVPEALHSDQVLEVIHYFHTMLRQVDSSLLEEWEQMKNPGLTQKTRAPVEEVLDITRNKRVFYALIRNECFRFLRLLALGDYDQLLILLKELSYDGQSSWTAESLNDRMTAYFDDHQSVCFDTKARSQANVLIKEESLSKDLGVDLILTDPDENNDWIATFIVNLDESSTRKRPVLSLTQLSQIG